MIDLLMGTRLGTSQPPHHHIRLNREYQGDLAWLGLFLHPWYGVSLTDDISFPTIEIASDASHS